MDRRRFLQSSGLMVALGAAGNLVFDLLAPRRAHAFSPASLQAPLPAATPILVVIELAGGNDMLNTHIPYAVPGVTGDYLKDRPNLAIKTVSTARPYLAPAPGDYRPPALDLDGQYGLHGNLPWLANRWWSRGDVAIVQGVGENVVKDFSHFSTLAYRWAAAFSGANLATGWLGRYNDLQNQNQVLASISLGGATQPLLGAATPVLSLTDVVGFDWRVSNNLPSRSQLLASLAATGVVPAPPTLNKVRAAGVAMANASAAISTVRSAAAPALNAGTAPGTLAYQLRQAAMLITGGMPCQTYVTGMSGFDHHAGQVFLQWEQFGVLDQALQGFFGVIDASPRAADVFVLITSEFGRQVKENAAGGTDHGRAGAAFLIGGGVQGGLYGQMPSLAVRDFDSLIPTVDFRSLYATVLNRLGGDPALTAAVLGKDESNGDFGDLGVFT